jgi:putative intracellular protease/amidase
MKSLEVLIIATSHKSLGDTSEDTGVWLDELTSPYYIFKDAGECITIATPNGGLVPIDPKSELDNAKTDSTRRLKTDDQAMYHLSHSLPLNELKAEHFDLIFIAGGHGAMIDLANNKTLSALLSNFSSENKPIGAVGSGVVALLPLELEDGTPFVKGRKLTAYSNAEVQMEGLSYEVPLFLETKLLSLGAFYSRSPDSTSHVIVDGKMVTGQNPASSANTAKELLSIAHSGKDNFLNLFGTFSTTPNSLLEK